jgi:fructokinase
MHSSDRNTQGKQPQGRPVLFGEVLFDCFGEEAVPGGAPLNAAWHLQALGWNPLIVSRVGTDALGDDIQRRMEHWGLDTAGLQRDPDHPTGRVEVEMQGRSHTFRILEDQAYDHIAADEALCAVAAEPAGLLYHGSMALRAGSQDVLTRLAAGIRAPVFLDINLRAPFWTRDAALEMIAGAGFLKLNDEELRLLRPGALANLPLKEAACEACRQWDLEALWLTLGAEGSFYCAADGSVLDMPPPENDRPVVDTVGAGDAFSAAVLGGLLKGSAPAATARCATELATRICGQRGATTTDRGLYAGLEAVTRN